MLVVVVFETKASYIEKYLDISEFWYASGKVNIQPLLNQKLINEINQYKPNNINNKCLKHIEDRWPYFQEITAKVLNSIDANNHELLSLAYPNMIKEMLILLSYLNQTPYQTLGSYIKQSRKFKIKPEKYSQLIEYLLYPNQQKYSQLENDIIKMYSSLESILERAQVHILTIGI